MIRLGVVSRLCIVALGMAEVVCTQQPVVAQGTEIASILSPADGAVVQGQVSITGSTNLPSFQSSELSFSYVSDPTQTWFLIQTASLPVSADNLAVWDTALITDGDYVLRLRVIRQDGSFQDAMVTVRVRNYTAVPTATPAITPTATAALEIPTAIVIRATETSTAAPAVVIATPTDLPPNPAGVTTGEIYSRLWRGALLVAVFVLAFGALIRFRR